MFDLSQFTTCRRFLIFCSFPISLFYQTIPCRMELREPKSTVSTGPNLLVSINGAWSAQILSGRPCSLTRPLPRSSRIPPSLFAKMHYFISSQGWNAGSGISTDDIQVSAFFVFFLRLAGTFGQCWSISSRSTNIHYFNNFIDVIPSRPGSDVGWEGITGGPLVQQSQ